MHFLHQQYSLTNLYYQYGTVERHLLGISQDVDSIAFFHIVNYNISNCSLSFKTLECGIAKPQFGALNRSKITLLRSCIRGKSMEIWCSGVYLWRLNFCLYTFCRYLACLSDFILCIMVEDMAFDCAFTFTFSSSLNYLSPESNHLKDEHKIRGRE